MARPRTIVFTAAGLILGLLLVIVSAGAILSQTGFGRSAIRNTLLPVLNSAIPGSIHIGKIEGNLFTSLSIDSVEIKAPDGTLFLATGLISLEYDPRDLMDRRIVVRYASINRPVVNLVDYGNDDWNWKRALKSDARSEQSPANERKGFGDWIRIDSASVVDATIVVADPWRPADSLSGSRRDSAIAYNIARRDVDIRKDGDRFVKVRRWLRTYAELGPSRIAHPDTAGLAFAVRRIDAVEMDPMFWFQNTSGMVRIVQDSLWVDSARIHLPSSGGRGQGKIVWGSDLPMRWDLKIQGDSVAFTDLAWISPVLPHVGGGSADIHIRNNPRNVHIVEYAITRMDARSHSSRLRGNMTFGVGDTVLRVTDVALNLDPMHTDMLRWMNAEPFPYDWQGAITGSVVARGGPVTRFQVDEARVQYSDSHVSGALTSGVVRGQVDILVPSLAVFKDAQVDLDRLDLRTPRYVNPLFPNLEGIVSGTMRLDSVWTDVRFTDGRFYHSHGEGDTSLVTGSGRITLLEDATAFDVDMTAAPLSFTTMSKSYPGLPLRGFAVGPIRAQGTAENFSLNTALAGDGGEVAFSGTVDAFEPEFAASGTLRVTGAELKALLGDTLIPSTSLGGSAEIDIRGESLSSLTGSVFAELSERSSRVGDIPVYAGIASLGFVDGKLHLDSLSLESSALRLSANGALGLVADARDTLRLIANADSLGGLRELGRLFGVVPTLSDSAVEKRLSGSVSARALLAASLDTLDNEGVYLDVSVDARQVELGTSSARKVLLDGVLLDAFGSRSGSVSAIVDTARLGGIDAVAVAAKVDLFDGGRTSFSGSLRSFTDAYVQLAGSSVSEPDSSLRLNIHRFDLNRSDTSLQTVVTKAEKGFALVHPFSVFIGNDGSSSLDSLFWRHADGGSITVSGDISSDGALVGMLDADRTPLSDFGDLFRPSAIWQGSLDGAIRFGGTRQSPLFSANMALRDARFGPIHIGHLDAASDYSNRRLTADLSLVLDGQAALTASASLPIDMALDGREKRLLNDSLQGRITSEAVDLRVLESLVPSMQNGFGRLDTDIALGGTWDNPRLVGSLSISDGGVTLAWPGIVLERLSADVKLQGDTVRIHGLTAKSGPLDSDTISLSGLVAMKSISEPVFDLELVANSFLAMDRPRSATLTVSTVRPLVLKGPRNSATLEGAARIDRGRIYLSSLSQRRALDLNDGLDIVDTSGVDVDAVLGTAPEALVQGLTLEEVRLDIGDDVWLRSPEANIKIGGGLRLTRSVDALDGRVRLALADSLTVQRGTYQLNLGLARPGFDVERGTIRFFGDPELDPALDIAALHVVRQQRANSNRQDVRIRVHMGGTLNQPTLTLSSADNPPLPESDMLSYLVTGEPAYALFGTPYADQGATLALRLAGSYLSSRLAGGRFDLVQVEPTALNPGEASNLRQSGLGILAATRIGVGGQVGQKTFLSVTTGLCGLAPQSTGSADPLSLFAQGLGVKLEREFDSRFSAALGVEPGSSAQSCGRPGASRTFQQTPPQIGIDFFRRWSW